MRGAAKVGLSAPLLGKAVSERSTAAWRHVACKPGRCSVSFADRGCVTAFPALSIAALSKAVCQPLTKVDESKVMFNTSGINSAISTT